MAPTFRSSRSGRQMVDNTPTRNRAGQIDHDVFEGLPVRRWSRQSYTVSQDTKLEEPSNLLSNVTNNANATSTPGAQTGSGSSQFPELPMPKDSNLLSPSSRALLRAARAGCKYIKIVNNNGGVSDRDKQLTDSQHQEESSRNVADGNGGTSTPAHQRSFTARKWAQVPRHMEPPEPEFLAKRRPGLPSLYGASGVSNLGTPSVSYVSGAAYPFRPTDQPMRKTKFKRTDPETGKALVYEVWLPEGHHVEGEIQEHAPEAQPEPQSQTQPELGLEPTQAEPIPSEVPVPLSDVPVQNEEDTEVTTSVLDVSAMVEPSSTELPPSTVDITLPPPQPELLAEEPIDTEMSVSLSTQDLAVPSKRRSVEPDDSPRKRVMFATEQFAGATVESEQQVIEEQVTTVQTEEVEERELELERMDVDAPVKAESVPPAVEPPVITMEDSIPATTAAEDVPTTVTGSTVESQGEIAEEIPAEKPVETVPEHHSVVKDIRDEMDSEIPEPAAVAVDAPESAVREEDTVPEETELPPTLEPLPVPSPPTVSTVVETQPLPDPPIAAPAVTEIEDEGKEPEPEPELEPKPEPETEPANEPVPSTSASTDEPVPEPITSALEAAVEPVVSDLPHITPEPAPAEAESAIVPEVVEASGEEADQAKTLVEDTSDQNVVPDVVAASYQEEAPKETPYKSPSPPSAEPIPENEGVDLQGREEPSQEPSREPIQETNQDEPKDNLDGETVIARPEMQAPADIPPVFPEAEPKSTSLEEAGTTESELRDANNAESEEGPTIQAEPKADPVPEPGIALETKPQEELSEGKEI